MDVMDATFASAILFFMPKDHWAGVIGHGSIINLLKKWVERPAFAYIFYGPQHIGKHLLADKFVRALLDYPETPDLQLHPDVVLFLPEEGKRDVSVDVVRKNRLRLQERPQLSKRVVGFLPQLDRLNEAGYNALLKIMEEPPADAVFVGVADNVSQIPATIISRSVCVPLSLVPRLVLAQGLTARGFSSEQAATLAEKSRGRPGLALDKDDEALDFEDMARAYAVGPSIGHRLSAVDRIREACESQEDPLATWNNALTACSVEIGRSWIKEATVNLILAQGVADALAAVGGAVSPHLMLSAAALRAAESKLSLPGLFPRYFPLSLEA